MSEEKVNTSEYADCLPSLKKIQQSGLGRVGNNSTIINWFNKNNIDYYGMSDLDMIIYYIEKNNN